MPLEFDQIVIVSEMTEVPIARVLRSIGIVPGKALRVIAARLAELRDRE